MVTKYIGRHRKPSTASQTATKIAAVGVTAVVPMALMTTPAQAHVAGSVEGAIIACESGGNPRAQNPSSTASGLYQFINSTWRAYGGSTPRARDASVAEQKAVFDRAFAAEGTRPWNASKSCWQGKSVAAPVISQPRQSAAPVGSRGSYTCDRAHLYFEACDEANLGEVVAYPTKHSGRDSRGLGTYTCDRAHLYFEACDHSNLGELTEYPLYS